MFVANSEISPLAESERKGARELALRLLKDEAKSLGWRYVGFVLAMVGFGLVSLLPPKLFQYFTESVQLLKGMDAQTFLVRLAVFGAVVSIALLISSLGSTLVHEWLRLRLETDLRRQVMRRLHQAPLSVLDEAQRGDWLTRMTGDLARVEGFLTESLPNQMRQVTVLVGAGTLFFAHTGTLAFLPLGSAVVLALLNVRMQKRLAPILGELRTLHGGIFQLLIESLEGIRTIRSHSGEPYIQRRFDAKLSEITQKSFGVVRILGVILGGTEMAGQLLVTACLVAASWGLSKGGLTLEEVLVYPFFIGMFYGAAQGLASEAYDWNRFFIEGGRLAELLYTGFDGDGTRSFSRRETRSPLAETLQVKDLVVGHKERVAAGPLSVSVSRGEILGLMGPSGCGKSTFLEVLAGLRPAISGGTSLIDASGKTLWENSIGMAASSFPIGPCAFVEQHPYIFEGTLRDNLTFGNPERLSDALIWSALERTGMFSFVRRNGGLDHLLRDRGRNLSEGERYRIALCRALLLARPFLLLDEPFAALDEESIRIICATLQSERAVRGTVVVTHHLPKVFTPDRVLNFVDYPSGSSTEARESGVSGNLTVVSELNEEVLDVSPIYSVPGLNDLKALAINKQHN